MSATRLQGNRSEMQRTGRLAFSMNPYNGRVAGGLGYMLTLAGEFEEGLDFLSKSEELQPGNLEWRTQGIFLANYALGNNSEAISRGRTLRGSVDPVSLAMFSISAAAQNRPAEASEALNRFFDITGLNTKDIGEFFERWSYADELTNLLVSSLEDIAAQP